MSVPPGVFLTLREPEDARFYPSVIPVQSYAPSTSARVWLDTSTVPPTLKGWNGSAWVPLGGTGVLNQTELTTEDLNALKTPGFYIQSDTAEATLGRNYPVASLNGHIVVESAGGGSPARVAQTFAASSTTEAGARRFWRTFASPTWSPWVELATPEVVRDTMGSALVAGSGVTVTPNDGANTITIAAIGGAARNWVPNTWCLPGGNLKQTTSNEATSAATLYMVPFFAAGAGTVTDIAINVQTAAGAGNAARLGIYKQDASGAGWTLVNDAGTVAIDSTGQKTLTGLSIALTGPGVYGVAVLPQAACTLTSQGADAGLAGFQNPFSTSARVYMSVAQAYGALPATASPVPGGGFSSVFHRALVKLA